MTATTEITERDAPAVSGFLPGFSVLFDKEMREARRQKRIIIFAVVMTFLVMLVPTVAALNAEDLGAEGGRVLLSRDNMDALLGVWAGMVGYLGALMVIAATVDAVSHERNLGITAWIVTKPVARQSYLLAKIAAHTLVAIGAVVLIPTFVFLVFAVALFADVPLVHVGAAVVVLCVEMLFLSTIVVALGVVLRSIMPILLIALGAWFLPLIIPLPAFQETEWTVYVLPSHLPLAAILASLRDPGEYAAAALSVPLVALGLSILLITAAIALFEKQEL